MEASIISGSVCQKCHTNVSLTYFKQSLHEGIDYKCEVCDYNSTGKSNLTKHRQSIHDTSILKMSSVMMAQHHKHWLNKLWTIIICDIFNRLSV